NRDLRFLLVDRRFRLGDNEALIWSRLLGERADLGAGQEPAGVLVEVFELFELLRFQQLGPILPEQLEVEEVAFAEHYALRLQQRQRGLVCGGGQQGGFFAQAFPAARHAEAEHVLVILLVQPGRRVGGTTGDVGHAAQEQERVRVLRGVVEAFLYRGQLPQR